MTPTEEQKAKECCKSGVRCKECPLYNPKGTTDECYKFWEKHSPYSKRVQNVMESEDISFQEEMWSVLGDMTEAQAKEAVEFFKEKYNWKEVQ